MENYFELIQINRPWGFRFLVFIFPQKFILIEECLKKTAQVIFNSKLYLTEIRPFSLALLPFLRTGDVTFTYHLVTARQFRWTDTNVFILMKNANAASKFQTLMEFWMFLIIKKISKIIIRLPPDGQSQKLSPYFHFFFLFFTFLRFSLFFISTVCMSRKGVTKEAVS